MLLPSECHELERAVIASTGRRVIDLSVRVGDGRIELHGRADSFHVKQLAQQGVLARWPDARLVNAITVNRTN